MCLYLGNVYLCYKSIVKDVSMYKHIIDALLVAIANCTVCTMKVPIYFMKTRLPCGLLALHSK